MTDNKKQIKAEWISVKDRMPNSWEKVLVYTKQGAVEMSIYSAIGGWKSNVSVTHWMPLPEAPKMKGE